MKSKIQRQVEIVSFIQSQPKKISIRDLCDNFSVESAQIQRDLRELRMQAICIHSTKKGIVLEKPLTSKQYNTLLSIYLSQIQDVIEHPKNITLTTKKLKESTLIVFTSIVNAIQNRNRLKINYVKHYSGEVVIREIAPYYIVPTNRNWRLLAESKGYLKQFYIENIREVVILPSSFAVNKKIEPKLLFKYSFEIWGSEDEYSISLLFSANVASQILNGVWSEEQEIEELDNGKVRLRMIVNSIEQVGNWVITFGSNVTIEQPLELKSYVLNLAAGIMSINNGAK